MTEPPSQRSVTDMMNSPPVGYFVVLPDRQGEEVTSLADIVAVAVASWRTLVVTTLAAAVVAGTVSQFMPSMYRAQALVLPVDPKADHGGIGSTLGGLAGLAGIDLGNGGQKKDEFMAILSSPGFARDFIAAENLMPILYADKWDAGAKHWRDGVTAPTVEGAVKKFSKKVRTIFEDRKTGVVTVSVEWKSPQLAADWVNGMINMVNERVRAEAIRNAEESREYLNRELAKSTDVELQRAIYRLLEDQVNNAMMANVRREYAFHFIDPAVPPQVRISPQPAMMIVVGGTIGLVLGLMIVFLRRALRPPGRSSRI